MIGWAWFAAGFYLGITAAALVYEEWRGWVGQRRRRAAQERARLALMTGPMTWRWDDPRWNDWLHDSAVDQRLEQR